MAASGPVTAATLGTPPSVKESSLGPYASEAYAAPTSARLRPEVPNFEFSSRPKSEAVRCTRCSSVVGGTNSFCPQCGASMAAPSSPLANAAHYSMPPVASLEGVPTAFTADSSGLAGEANHTDIKPPSDDEGQRGRSTSTIRPTGIGGETLRPRSLPGNKSGVARPCLAMLAPDGSVARFILLESERVDIGRLVGEVVLPDDVYLSERHARFTHRTVGATAVTSVRDLDSLNGVYLRVRELAELRDGDWLLAGLELLKFEQVAPDSCAGQPIQVSGCSLFGSAISPRYARLSEMTSDGMPRSVFVIGRDETILGREVGDIVFTDDPFMSRRHAALTRNPATGVFTLKDLDSSNGTFLRVRGKVELKAGDHLRIGQQLFRYDMINP